ncbi:flagellar basal body rod protein FlgB [Tepidibacillus marianensis]|uniref:flagellar basal body rod protein FlgB n=1 Tax=Tepidibacillus marianensis TaxID=3131995 RepID=UPI0030CF0A18
MFLIHYNPLERALDVSATRQKLITGNIANVEMPRYKTMDVSFDEILNHEQSKNNNKLEFEGYRTDPRHLQIGSSRASTFQPKIITENRTSLLNNENNVDIDYEMTKLAENNIWYSTLSQITSKEFSMLRYVISEGRR